MWDCHWFNFNGKHLPNSFTRNHSLNGEHLYAYVNHREYRSL